MTTTSWDETRGKIKQAYDKVDSAYRKYVAPNVDKVKQQPILNTAVKISLSAIPIIGPNLRDLYDNIGGGGAKSEEEKAKQILDFLSELEQKNKEEFNRIAEDLKSNSQAIIDAINQNKIQMTALITNSWKEIVDRLYTLQKTADVTLDKVEAIAGGVERIQQSILEQRSFPSREYKRPPKPSTFRGESTKIFVGRRQDIDTIKNYFAESNLPVSITGEGGIGKSELAYKLIHECENFFDLIIPVYFDSILPLESFLLEMTHSLSLPVDELEKKDLGKRRDIIINALGQGEFKHPLIYADNYETVSRVLSSEASSALTSSKEEKNDARKINAFLESVPPNTAVLLTSRERHNLDGERVIRLSGLSEAEGRDLFLQLAKNHFPTEGPSGQLDAAFEEISRKTGGHPLSIELLARSYRGEGVSEIRAMLEHLGAGLVNPREESERLKSLESCIEYTTDKLPQTYKDLLSKLILFTSPFPVEALESIFGFERSSNTLLDLYDHSLLRRIDFHDYASTDHDESLDKFYRLYYFHPAIRNYLEHKAMRKENDQDLEEKYGNSFSMFYHKFLKRICDTIGTKDQILSLELFSVIWEIKDNDFDRALRLAEDKAGRLVACSISSYLGVILSILGKYNAALEYYKKCLAIDEQLQDKLGIAIDQRNIGIVLLHQGNYDQALEYHMKALKIHEKLNDRVEMARDYISIGNVLESQGNYDQALEYHNKASVVHQSLQDSVGIAGGYTSIGNVLMHQGNYDQALECFYKALKIHEELNDRVGLAGDYNSIGLVLRYQGNYDQALEYHMKALKIHEEFKDKTSVAGDYTNIGNVLMHQGNYDQALEYFYKALTIQEELQDRVGMARNYRNVGNILHQKQNYDQALEYHMKALKIHEKLNDRVGLAIDYNSIGLVHNAQRNYDQALEYHMKALKIDEPLNDRVGLAIDYNNIGLVLRYQRNYDQALECFYKALKINEELNDRVGMAKNYTNIGLIFRIMGNHERAIEFLSKALKVIEEFEKIAYPHPLSDDIKGYLTELHQRK